MAHESTLSPGAYFSRVLALSKEFQRAGEGFADSVSADSTARQAGGSLLVFERRVYSIARRLARLDAPVFARAANRRLARAFAAIARACQPAVTAGLRGDVVRFRLRLRVLQARLNGSLGREAIRAADAIDRLNT